MTQRMFFGLAALLVLLVAVVGVQNGPAPAADPVRQPRKVAFLVGANTYDHDFPDLYFAERDVIEVSKVLAKDGYEVVLLVGSAAGKDRSTKKNVEGRLKSLLEGDGNDAKKVAKGDVVVVYLCGHGVQMEVKDPQTGGKVDTPFFCPVDGKSNDSTTLVNISYLLDDLLGPCGSTNLMLIDACRSIGVDKTRSRGINGREMALRGKTGVLFSCDQGETAAENPRIQHGVFTYAVLTVLRGKTAMNSPITWSGLVHEVQNEMASDDFKTKYLKSGQTQTPISSAGQLPNTKLLSLPASDEKVVEFEYVIEGVKKKGMCRVLTLEIGSGVKMEFVRIAKGKFTMGSPKDEKGHREDEAQKEVTIDNDFYIAKYETTQSQYKAVTGDSPSSMEGERLPVECVSWDDTMTKFCGPLSKKLNRIVRLPTEEQWEYACRAGTTTPFHFGSKLNGDLANCNGTSPYGTEQKGKDNQGKTVEVGSYPANPWGLYDMHGNAEELCANLYQEQRSHPSRGGTSVGGAEHCRSAGRGYIGGATYPVGFRVVMSTDITR